MNPRYRPNGWASSFLAWLCVVSLRSVLILSALPAWAQSTSTGTVSGQVTDRQNAVVQGAEAVLMDTSTNAAQTAQTNEVGRYIFLNVAPGTYDLTVSKSGFTQARVMGQRVEVGLVRTLNVTLDVGSTAITVDVQAAAGAALQTSNATVGTTISGDPLMNLPNLGRDANAFFVLQPAVMPGGQVAGLPSDQNRFELDGGNNTSDQDGSYAGYTASSGFMGAGLGGSPSGVMPTPVESIEEFKVATNNQTADFNGAGGAQVQMVTKRGTNQFHGSGYEYYFGSNLGANSWQNNHTPSRELRYTPLPSTHQNRFGSALGGPLTKSFWGGKTYFFVNYEGRRFPNVITISRLTPTALLRAGVIQVQNSSGQIIPYNLNPRPVTVNGVIYQPAMCGANPCDPRGVGLNPIISEIWNKYMPLPNDLQAGDRFNTQGYLTPLRLPLSSNFAVARIDHDFGPNWRFMASYRYSKFSQLTNNQVDIGGVLPGDTFGVAAAKTEKPQTPSYMVFGLSGVITSHLINDFRFNYLRNAWEWASVGAPRQLPGLGGALGIGADSAAALVPLPIDRGDGLARFWDGQDKVIRDDLSLIHGNHLFQFGGQYFRGNYKHQRNDNGINIMSSIVYQINSGPGIATPSAYVPSTVPVNQLDNWNRLYATVLGMVAQSQVFYARKAGQLLPVGSSISSESIAPTYNVYFSDSWHVRPAVTLTYGLGYAVEMPAYEVNGNQPMIVYSDGSPFTATDYLNQRQKAALAGQVYNPIVGFATIRNVKGNRKYLFDPYYGGLTPRVAAAWNPKLDGGILGKLLGSGKTVIRVGYGRTLARLNGINQVQVPLEGTGIGQPVSCVGASRTGECLGAAGVDPATAFRIGVDGLTAPLPSVSQVLPQPFFPGVGGNPAAATGEALGIDLKPAHTDQFDVTIQRELSPKVKIEVGYLGVRIRDEQMWFNLDSVPYMTTLGGQSFAQAFANIYQAMSSGQTAAALQPQPFFETALGGPRSTYCANAASCTAALASNQRNNILTTHVYDLWTAMNSAPGWILGRTMPSSNPTQVSVLPISNGWSWGNYNAGFVSLRMVEWHRLTATSNLTLSRALGTAGVTQNGLRSPVDQWNLRANYGSQPYDTRWVYNLFMFYRPPVFKAQRGVLGNLLSGWAFAPLFTAQSGIPLNVAISGGASTGCQSFGEANCAYNGAGSRENAVALAPMNYSTSAHYNVVASGVAGTAGNASSGGSGINMFENPSAVYSNFRRLILGVDTNGGGAGVLRGFPTWNLDMAVTKDIRVREGMGATLSFQFVNILNHFQPANPSLNIDSPTNFGVIGGQSNTPRQMEFGLRIFF